MWRGEFQFKDLLSNEDLSPYQVRGVAAHLVARLKATEAFTPPTQRRLVAVFSGIKSQDDFNEGLGELYDAADAERVWTGFALSEPATTKGA